MATITKIIADFQTRLTAKISVGGTSGALQSNLDSDGNALPNGYYFFTLDGDNGLKEYIYCQLTDTILSNIYSVSVQGVKTSGTKREHRFRALIEITNFAQIKLLGEIWGGLDTLDGTNPLKYDTTATIDDNKKIGTKAYVDGKTIGVKAKASASVNGVAEMSAAPADANNPIAVGDNDGRVPTAGEKAAMAGSYGTPGSSNKYVTNDHAAMSGNMDLSNAQSVAGVKTFSTPPVMPGNPSSDNQMSNKAYALSILYTS